MPPDLLRRLLERRSARAGTRPEDYGLSPGERLNEVITHSWNRLRRHYGEFCVAAANLPEGEAGTGLTNDKWSLPLLRELGFGFLPASAGPEIAGRTYAIGRFFGPVAVHLVGRGLSLDRRAAGQRGAAAANPHGLVQEFLNRSDAHLWAIVSNGLRLRILRDNQTLSRQSFLEFDLEAMFAGEVYSDFVLLWLIVHASRFAPREGDRPETCWLEQWTREAERQGARALGELRGGVERALRILGRGFTSHPHNAVLREALRSGALPPDGFHGQILRVVYRLIFLFVAEDRTLDGQSLLHPHDDSDSGRAGREAYAAYYGTARLRQLAGRIKGSRHGDLWRQFRLLAGALSGEPDFEIARQRLALPALGSFLWSRESTPELNDAELTNYDFLEALRHLAFTRQNRILRPVDYRNIGAEELGGVYESLLALTPRVSGDGADFTFAEFAGNTRKTSGSYYTPDTLVQRLLDSALDPVVAEAVRGKSGADAERAILDLKVCDPAVGSGHFLVGAAHRLARHLARVRAHSAGESEPSPLLYQHALRDVIGRCLYGVDMNPMAAELCRVSLWLEALEPGKPLSFLDHHIRIGNSLLGTTPELVEAGLPDGAFKPLQGDDSKICSGLRRRNKAERKSGQQDMGYLMVAEPRAEYGTLASRRRWIDESPDDTLGEVQRKEAQFQCLVVSPQYRRRQQVADAWCAAFVQPKQAGRDPALCITTDALRGLDADPDALAPAQRREVERFAREYQFFHWHLAFPEVFENGGFDCVLGNPPWERVKLQEKEWFAERSPEIANAPNAAARKRMIQALATDDPEFHREYLDALRQSEGWSHLMRNSGRFPLCARGDINFYAVFAEAIRNVVNERGRVGCVLPTGIATDDTTKFFFQDIVETKSLVSLFDFENKGVFFPGVHSSYKFCLFTAGSGAQPATDHAEFAFFAHAVEELHDPERRFTLSPEDISLLNPNTLTCPTFRSRRDAELAKAIYRRVPVLIREARDGEPEDNPWGIRFSTMFHMSNDSHLFHTREQLEADGWQLAGNVFRKDGTEYLPLYEAKMIHHFDHRWASYRTEDGKDVAVDVSGKNKQDPDIAVLPRYWVAAREVHLRVANLPKGLLAALRDRHTDLIALGVCHLLFLEWLHRCSGGSADAAIAKVFPSWIDFVAHHPFALEFAPTQMGLCGNNPACIQPLGPSYLPAEPIDATTADSRSSTAWYAVDPSALRAFFASFAPYVELLDSVPSLRGKDEALTFAEELLSRASPRWLMGWRDIARSTDERTVLGGVFLFSAVGHNLPVWATDSEYAVLLPALLSSPACDFAARFKVGGTHLSFFIAEQIPVLPPEVFDRSAPWSTRESVREWLLPRILELIFTAWGLVPFAADCGWEDPPFRWDNDRRFLLRCELDAAFFHLYLPAEADGDWRPARRSDSCPRDETPEQHAELKHRFPTPRDAVAYIMDTFPIVRRKDEEKHDEYRTKRVILEIYDEMQQAIRTGRPCQTRLNPLPADRSCCHPPRTIAPAFPVAADLAELSDGEWCRPGTDRAGDEAAVLAAILKAAGAPVPMRKVRLAAVLTMEPRLLTPSLPTEEAAHWRRLVGPQAEQLPAGVTQLQPRVDQAWGQAVRQLRGIGYLIEDLSSGTWAPGPGLGAIHTEGWPDGRVGVAMRVLHSRGDDAVVQTLPPAIRDLIDATAA